MASFVIAWAVSSIVIFLAIYLLRCIGQHRLARPWRMHVPGVIALAVVLGWIPAYLYDTGSARTVDLPPELRDDRPPAQGGKKE